MTVPAITTLIPYRGSDYLVTVIDRPPRKGEGIWYVPAGEPLEDVLTRVVSGVETIARTAGTDELAFHYRATEDFDPAMPYDAGQGRLVRVVVVDVAPVDDDHDGDHDAADHDDDPNRRRWPTRTPRAGGAGWDALLFTVERP